MSAARNLMLPPASKGRAARNQGTDIAPDPNANRTDEYPNNWRIEYNKQTAKCTLCGNSQAGTKWCVACTSCNKRMCSPCWKGERFNRYGEAIFEGKAQNDEGCWCRFNNRIDPRWQPAFEARSQRMKAVMAQEKAQLSREQKEQKIVAHEYAREEALRARDQAAGIVPPPAKKQKLVWHGVDVGQSADARGRRSDYPQILQSADDWNPRRRSSAEDSVQEAFMALPRENESHLKDIHLHKKTTIIVGAGVIGLSIARELAAQTYQTATEHTIVVVEKLATIGEGASGQCAGLIAKHSVPEAYGSLLTLSLKCWTEQLANKQFRDKIHFVPNSIVHVKPKMDGRFEHTAKPPSWYNTQPLDIFRTYDSDVGKISTRNLLNCLYESCYQLGVQFRFSQEILRIDKTMRGNLESVDIGSSLDGNNNEVNVPCHNIIVAAGTQTPEALHDFLPWLDPRTTFHNHKQHYEWVRAPFIKDTAAASGNVGLVLRDTSVPIETKGKDKGKGKATNSKSNPSSSRYLTGPAFSVLTADPQTKTILAATINKNPILPGPRENTQDNNNSFSPTELLTRSHLNALEISLPAAPASRHSTEASKITTGCTTVSSSFHHRALISMIPWPVVDDRVEIPEKGEEGYEADDVRRRLGIYVAYGFGRYGTTFAPGVARVVADGVFGREFGVGFNFAWPEGFDR